VTGELKTTLQGHTDFVKSLAFFPITIEMAAKALDDTMVSTNLDYDVARSVLAFDKFPRVGHRHPNPYPGRDLWELTFQSPDAMEGSDTESKSDTGVRVSEKKRKGMEEDEVPPTNGDDGKNAPPTNGDEGGKGSATKKLRTEEHYRNVRKQMCAWCRARSSRLVSTGTSRRQVWRMREGDRPY
jgi:hypothetical protein